MDTGLLVALVNSRDAHHTWALRVAEQVAEPLLTCEPVLAETAFHLGNVELILEMVSEEFVALAFDCNDHLPQLIALAKRYADRRPDLADLCLIHERTIPKSQYHHRESRLSRLPREQTRGDSADLPALNPNSPRERVPRWLWDLRLTQPPLQHRFVFIRG